jgi:hypothetical protein
MVPSTHDVDDRDMDINRLRWSNLTGWGRAHMGWAILVVGLFAVMLTGAALSDQPEGTCSGIGWGCELAGPDLALLILMFVGPLVLGVLVAGHALIGIVHMIARRAERPECHSSESCVEGARN